MNAFKHGLTFIQKRREEGIPTEHEESIKQQILDGLIADKGEDQQISTATRIRYRHSRIRAGARLDLHRPMFNRVEELRTAALQHWPHVKIV